MQGRLIIQLILINLFFHFSFSSLNFTVVIFAQLIDAYEHSEYFFYGVVANRLPSDKDRLLMSLQLMNRNVLAFSPMTYTTCM